MMRSIDSDRKIASFLLRLDPGNEHSDLSDHQNDDRDSLYLEPVVENQEPQLAFDVRQTRADQHPSKDGPNRNRDMRRNSELEGCHLHQVG